MIPISLCKQLDIVVTNQPGSNADSVGEIALSLATAVSRRTVELDRRLRRGEFMPNIDFLAPSLDYKVVGVVGMGDIARSFARRMVVSCFARFLSSRAALTLHHTNRVPSPPQS